MITPAAYSLVLLSLLARVLSYPQTAGNNNQWSNPRVGMWQQQQQGYNGGQSNGYGGENRRGFGNSFGQAGGYSPSGGRQPGQGQGSEAYHSHVFNEPDRYGYDYTMPGATVHYLMHKKQGNRGSGGSYGSYGGY